MKRALIREILEACRRQPKLTTRMLGFLTLGLIASLLTPWPLKLMIDRVLQSGTLATQRWPGIWFPLVVVTLSFLYFALTFARGYFNHQRHMRLTEWADLASENLRGRLFARILNLKASVAQNLAAEDLRLRLGEDIDRIRDSWVEVFSTAFAETLTLVGAFAVLFLVDWRFATLSLIGLGLLSFIYTFFPRRITEENKSVREAESSRALQLGRAVTDRILVKAWTQEKNENLKLAAASESFAKKNLDKARWEGRFIFSVEGITALVQAMTLAYGAFRVAKGTLTVGDLVLFLQYLMLMHAPIGRLSAFLVVFHRGVASWNRVDEALKLEIERNEEAPAVVENKWIGLEFHGVAFGYHFGQNLFENISFRVDPGQIAVVVGPSGVGKSTLLKMILGLYEPKAGEISWNGESLARMNLQALRRQIAYVDQESGLFSASLRENLTYGQESVDENKMQRICRELQIDSFVATWPYGYDTFLNERGANLSLGQRQRIVLARALISDRPLILMDEPTSALDLELESELIEKLPSLLQGRTAILVTHRTAPLKLAHQIVHLEKVLDPYLYSSLSQEMHP